MSHQQLSNFIAITRMGEGSTGTTSLTEAVDMANFQGVVFLGNSGTTGTALTLTASHGASTTGFVALSGGTHATTGGNDIGVLDVYRPRKRYVRCVATSATTVNIRMSLYAIRYGPRVIQSSTNDTLVVSPDT